MQTDTTGTHKRTEGTQITAKMKFEEIIEAEIAKFLPILAGMTPELTANTRSVLKLLHCMVIFDLKSWSETRYIVVRNHDISWSEP